MRLIAPRISRLALPLILSLSLMMSASCARKGPVRPKLQSLPQAAQNLNLQQRGTTLLLSWEAPEFNQDGAPAEDLARFEVQRLVYDADEACPTCREPETVVARVDIAHPDPAQRVGKRYYWLDDDTRHGQGYLYRIVPLTIGRQAGEATEVHALLHEPIPAPAGLTATAGDRQVELRWQTTDPPAGMSLVGYNLYRRQKSLPWPPVAINPEPLAATELLDLGLANGTAYEYRLSVLLERDGVPFESSLSPPLLITPQQR